MLEKFKFGRIFNEETPDLSDLITPLRNLYAIWCSSFTCYVSKNNNVNKKGVPVYVGNERLKACPRCGQQNFLFFDRVGAEQARNLRPLIEYYLKKQSSPLPKELKNG